MLVRGIPTGATTPYCPNIGLPKKILGWRELWILGRSEFGSGFGAIEGNIEHGSSEIRIDLLDWLDEPGTAARDRVSERGGEGLEGAAGSETDSFQ